MKIQPRRGLHLHLDPVSGIAGDMAVAALVDAGVPPSVVIDAIAAVGVKGLRVSFESRRRGAYIARGFVVEEPAPPPARRSSRTKPVAGQGHDHIPGKTHAQGRTDDAHAEHPHKGHVRESHTHEDRAHEGENEHRVGHGHRNYAEIRRLLRRAKLVPEARSLAEEIFARLAEVEADLHGTSIEHVAFHEVGAFDSIADIVGVSAAVAWLRPISIGSTPPVVGTGRVRTAHGIVPVPAPATAELLRGVPILSEGLGELTTPTGAAFLVSVVDSFGPPPPMRIAAVGYGAGSRDTSDRANVLRVILGETLGQPLALPSELVMMLEANIDDMSGQLLAALFDALFAAGALDVWSTAITMKKGRPAQKVSALTEPSDVESVRRAFFLNSTTLGIRVLPVSRSTLARSLMEVGTPFGPVRIKVAGLDGTPIDAQPEFEDCRRAASAAGVPVRRVWAAAIAAASSVTSQGAAASEPSRGPVAPSASGKASKRRKQEVGPRAPKRRIS